MLQRLKWSVESVRRTLLDESVTMLHRQTKLVQLDMGALDGERTPELAVGASESQLRGYVMLVAAKLPLVRNVHEFARLAGGSPDIGAGQQKRRPLPDARAHRGCRAAVKTGNILDIDDPDTDWLKTALSLWPIAVVAVVFYLVVPLIGQARRIMRDRAGASDSYPYEFTFRLQEAADAAKVRAFLGAKRHRRKRDTKLSKLSLTNRGGGRIERVSDDRALVKIHSIASFRVGFARYARFEVVNEILAHRVSGQPTYAIVQCRLFGDSPNPLRPTRYMNSSLRSSTMWE